MDRASTYMRLKDGFSSILIRHWSLPGSYRAVVKEPLDVVYQDAGHGGAVGVVEDAADLHALGRLREANHILGAGEVKRNHAHLIHHSLTFD